MDPEACDPIDILISLKQLQKLELEGMDIKSINQLSFPLLSKLYLRYIRISFKSLFFMFKEVAATLMDLIIYEVDIFGEIFEPNFVFKVLESFQLKSDPGVIIKVIELVSKSKKTLKLLKCNCDDYSSYSFFDLNISEYKRK
jgi:hypothetical protein